MVQPVMRQPGAKPRRFRADRKGAGIQGLGPDDETESARGAASVPAPRVAGERPRGGSPDARAPDNTERPRGGSPDARAPDNTERPRGGSPDACAPDNRAPDVTAEPAGTGRDAHPRLPPGQYVQASMPVLHYGPVPAFNRQTWDLRVYGATQAGIDQRWNWDGFSALPRAEIIADFHCVTKFSVLGITWLGVPAAEVLRAVPPSDLATHVMVWADFGYGANLPIDVLTAADTLLATHREGRELSLEQGYPVRLVVPSRYGWKNVKWVRAIEYMIGDRRGFWEERGYHNNADPWQEQRYSYQELPGEGPPM